MTYTGITLQSPLKKLTPRETEILTFTAYGKTRGEIAQILSISDTTVKEHIERVCRKLNVDNKTHASTVAITLGLIAPYKIVHQSMATAKPRVLQTEDFLARGHALSERNFRMARGQENQN